MKTRLVQKIFVFLLLTIGIVFILQRIHRTIREPFVSPERVDACTAARSACGGPKPMPDGKVIYLCPDEDSAGNLLDCGDETIDTLSPTNVQILGSSDAVCYVKVIDRRDVYICYNRPPPIVYEPPPIDAMVSQNYLDDYVPGQLEDILPATCDTYQAITSQVFKNFSTMTLNKTKVDNGLSILKNVQTEMSNLYKTRCSQPQSSASKQAACDHLKGFVEDATTTSNISLLQGLQLSTDQSLSTLKGFYVNDIVGGYSGLGCPEPNLKKPAGLE